MISKFMERSPGESCTTTIRGFEWGGPGHRFGIALFLFAGAHPISCLGDAGPGMMFSDAGPTTIRRGSHRAKAIAVAVEMQKSGYSCRMILNILRGQDRRVAQCVRLTPLDLFLNLPMSITSPFDFDILSAFLP